jgi:hypothetical protein
VPGSRRGQPSLGPPGGGCPPWMQGLGRPPPLWSDPRGNRGMRPRQDPGGPRPTRGKRHAPPRGVSGATGTSVRSDRCAPICRPSAQSSGCGRLAGRCCPPGGLRRSGSWRGPQEFRRPGFIDDDSDAISYATPTHSAGSSGAGPVSKITVDR